ncbi:MAG: ion channel [Hasllibacter sp.]
MTRPLILLAVLMHAALAAPAAAQDAIAPDAAAAGAPPLPERLRVGIVDRPPYAEVGADGLHGGLVVEIWRVAAERLGVATDWVVLEPDEMRAAVASNFVQVALPADASAPLEAALDLTHPVHSSHVGVATPPEGRVWSTVRGLASTEFLRIILALSALLLAVGAVIWLLERRENGDQFHPDAKRGLGDGFWWAGVTLTTIGYGDKAPATLGGRAVAMLWMLAGLAVSAALTAAVINVSGAAGAPEVPEDLRGRSVVALEEGAVAAFLARQGIEAEVVGDARALIRAVEEGGADAAVGAAAALQAAAGALGADVEVRSTLLDPILVGLAVRQGSPLREPLNRVLLEVITSEAGIDLIRRHLPEG